MQKVRCVHCLKYSREITRDHIFPKSWYPDNTPSDLERWTAPACLDCNQKLGELEEDIFIRMAMCVDRKEIASSGISTKAMRALGIIRVNLSEKERGARNAKLKEMLKDLQPVPPNIKPLPGFGWPAGHARNDLPGIKIPVHLDNVLEKIVRGLEHKLGNGRYVTSGYKLNTYIVKENSAQDVDQLINRGFIITHGPGFKIARNKSTDPKTVLYRVEIWNKLVMHASIIPTWWRRIYNSLIGLNKLPPR